jgi:1,4-alpha-glucan branching enzyme
MIRSGSHIKALSFCLIFITQLTCGGVLFGQNEDQPFYFKDGYVFVEVDRQLVEKARTLLLTLGTTLEEVAAELESSSKMKTKTGWQLDQFNDEVFKFKKKLKDFDGFLDPEHCFTDEAVSIDPSGYYLNADFGTNRFERPSVVENEDGTTTFTLFGYEKAQRVILAGTFNSWSTNSTPMLKTSQGWEWTMYLPEGKHLYKFIVDGHWMTDPSNDQVEMDWEGNENSVYYRYNYVFEVNGFQDAVRVSLAGSFNDWNETDFPMLKAKDGWVLPMFLKDGRHTYKLIVNGEWRIDTTNSDQAEDGMGNVNSVLSKGEFHVFSLKGFSEAKEVILSGDFIHWNEGELKMTKGAKGWTLPLALAPGNYQYKFIVDGHWMPDPDNLVTTGTEDYVNSIISIAPNHTFKLKGYKKEDEVIVTGTFNDWQEDGYRMRKTKEGWELPVYLPSGKTRYKFIVDEEWMIDPDNPLWENNTAGTKDSFIWR